MIAQRSKEDALVFQGNNPQAKQLARSILKSVSDGVDPRVKELMQLDDKAVGVAKAERLEQIRELKKKRDQRIADAKAKLRSTIGNRNATDFYVDTDIEIGSGIVDEPEKPTTFRKAQNQVTPDVIKHYEREMQIRAEVDAKRKNDAEAKRQKDKEFFDSIPTYGNPSRKVDTKTAGAKILV
jgi:hypothetical protein